MTKSQSKPKPVFPSLIESIWYIGFTDTESPLRWWNKFTKRNYRHIFMYAEVAGIVIIHNMTRGGLVTTLIDLKDDPGLSVHQYLMDLNKAHLVLPARGMISPKVAIPRLAPFTCVELARSILGIDKMVYTPWQLAEYVIGNRLAGTPLSN